MSSLKVLYSFPQWVARSGGVSKTAYYQVEGLVKQGVQVTLYCGALLDPVKGLHSHRDTLKFRQLKLPLGLLGTRRTASLHDRIVAADLPRIHNRDKIDIVHCWPSGALQTLKAAQKLGIKTVLERPSAHTGYVFEVTGNECKKLGLKLSRSHYAALNKKALIREESEFSVADKLLCPSEFVVKTFLDKGFNEERMLRHQYGADPDVFSATEQDSNKNGKSPFTIVYVGDCFPLKGLHFALQAWVKSRASKTGRFLICGRFMPQYQKLLKDYLAHPTVKCMGFVQDVQKIMANSDTLILPSLGEGSALVTYEARACGCVLLVSEAAGAICQHMGDALVHVPGDADILRRHIDLLASDAQLFSRLRTNSLTGIGELTWDKAAESLVRAYRECLNSTNKENQ
ncbi:MAG: glycosyltransferase family 4 protein [Phycisphaerales bacterium]|jgi:glycosyltransferase involved in cell wall biosynthesis